MADKLNLKQIRDQSKGDLLAKLTELKQELSQLRVAKVTGGAASRVGKIRDVRKSIAQVLTVYNAKLRQDTREALKGASKLPLDLRPRLTRAMRRRLTPKQAAAQTLKAKKHLAHFPERKFALKN